MNIPATFLAAIKARELAPVADGLLKGLLILLFRRISAALRHWVWTLSLIGALWATLGAWWLPGWRLPILPALAPSLGVPAAKLPATQEPPAQEPSATPPGHLAPPGSAPPLLLPPSDLTDAKHPKTVAPAYVWWLQPAKLLLVLWAAGVLACLLRPLLGRWKLRGLRRGTGTMLAPPTLAQRLLSESVASLCLRRSPRLLVGPAGSMPATWGWLRPVLLLPAAAETWSPAKLRFVLLHELAHVKRRDWLTQTLGTLACALHWPNPLAWLAAHRMRVEQERACDDLVLAAGARPSDYAEALLRLASRPTAPRWVPAIGMARRNTLERRLLAVLDGARRRDGVRGRWWLGGGLALLIIATPLAAVKLEERPAGGADASTPQVPVPAARLQFRLVSDDPSQPAELLRQYGAPETVRPLRVLKEILLDESAVAGAELTTDPLDGRLRISMELTPQGAITFADLTGRYLKQQLAIVFDGHLLMAPVIQARISGGRMEISGRFTKEEAQEIVAALNQGKSFYTDKANQASARLVVAPDGSGDYRTIQSALDAAPPGAIIQVRPGDYAEHLEITKPVYLRGQGWPWPEVTIRPAQTSTLTIEALQQQAAARMRLATSDAERREIKARLKEEFGRPVLTIRDVTNVVLAKLKFTALAPKGQSFAPAIISIRRAGVRMVDCAVLGGPKDGMHIADGASFLMKKCFVAAVWGTGLRLGDRALPPISALINDTKIRNCRYAGIRIVPGKHHVEISGCLISGAAWHGIRYDDTSPRISGNYIFGNARSGIYASGKTAAEVVNNVFHRNEMDGISCWFENHDQIRANTFVGNLREGLAILGSSQPEVTRNIFADEQIAILHGRIGSKRAAATNLVALRLERNLFWNNATNLMVMIPSSTEGSPTMVAKSLPPEAQSVSFDPGFVNAADGDFTLTLNSPARQAEMGAATGTTRVSVFPPLQPEELAIIPDTDTRDSRAWKKPPGME